MKHHIALGGEHGVCVSIGFYKRNRFDVIIVLLFEHTHDVRTARPVEIVPNRATI
jgi:hypothetical protein